MGCVLRIHWSFPACVVVLVGFAVTACDKEQMGQFLKTVQTGGCTENKPSNAAPEYCLYVEDVQIAASSPSNQTVNVVFKLVNRTHRTLYLGIQNWRAAGSSGNSYSGNGTTGIPYCQPCVPLAAEPGADTIFSANVSRTGMGDIANDRWISLAGEIGLVKTDSQGRPMYFTPPNFITIRGFNYSRLSLTSEEQSQRLQGSTPASQGTSTQLASSNAQENVSAGVSTNNSTNTRAVSSLSGAASGSPSVSAGVWGELDVQGIRIGATYEDVLKVLSAYKLKATRESPKEHRVKLQQIPDMPFLSSITGTFSTTGQMGSKNSEMQNFVAEFSPPPMKHEVSVVIINRSFWQDRPTMEATREALEAKYGPPSFKETADHREGWVWLYDASGAKIVSSSLKGQCSFTTVFHQGEPEYSININRNLDAVIGKCGRMLAVDMSYIPDGKDLLGSLKAALVDGSLVLKAAEATRALIAEREKEAMNKRVKDAEKVGRPSL